MNCGARNCGAGRRQRQHCRDSTAGDSTASAVTTTVVAAPAVLDVATGTHKGIPVGFTAEGFPFRGQPDAPVTIREYSDFECPFCVRHFVQTEPALMDAYLSSGQVRVIFRDFPIESLHPNAPAAHVASLCVAEQGAEKYWEMHDKIFQTQSECCLLYTSPSPRDRTRSRMPSSA